MSLIADLIVRIGADDAAWSSLQSTFEAAKTGVSGVADSFAAADSSVGGSLDSLQSSLSGFGESATTASGQFALFGREATSAMADVNEQMSLFDTSGIEAADSAFGSLAVSAGDSVGPTQEAAAAIVDTGSSAETAETGLSGMVEQLTLLGEALVITDGLKEFGQEALTAYGTVQSVTIGLTALTGSAQQADEIISKVKELAATEPFAFPEIAPTVQKMVALGVSTEQVGTVMQAAADASAATGNEFSQVANMLDRMSLSGTANARSMATLGISTADLGAAMGVTADEAAAAFKALDQSERIDVLSTALSKFAGTAMAEAQGIAGEWQIFKNQFEEVMVGVGAALAPVVGQILSFGKVALDALKIATDGFSALPGPVQDVIVVIGLAVAAVVPLTAGMAALGLAVIGLQGLPVIFSALTEAIGLTAEAEGTLAVSAGAASTALEAEGAIALTTAGEMDTAAVAAGGAGGAVGLTGALKMLGGAAAAAAAVFAGWSFGVWAADVKSASQQLQEMSAYAHDLGLKFDQTSASGDEFGRSLTKLESEAAAEGITIDSAGKTTQEYALALLTAMKNSDDAAAAAYDVAHGITAADTATKTHIQSATQLAQKITDLKDNLFDANTALQDAQQASKGDAASLQLIQAAASQVEAAQKALNSALGETTASLKAHKDTLDAVSASTQKIIDDEKNASDAWLKTKQAVVDGTGSLVALGVATDNLSKADAAYKQAIDAATGSLVAHGAAAKELATSVQGIVDAQTRADAALQTAIGVYNQIRQAALDGSVSTAAWTRAENDLISAWQAANPVEQGVAKAHGDVRTAALDAAAAVRGLSDGYTTIIENGKNVVVPQAAVASSFGDTSAAIGETAVQAQNLEGVMSGGFSDIIITVGKDASKASDGVLELNAAVGSVMVEMQTAEGTTVGLADSYASVGVAAKTSSDGIIQLRGSVTDVTTATSNLKDGQLYLNGVLTDYQTILKNLAAPEADQTKSMTDLATATQSAADAQNNLNSADSASSSGGSGKGKKGSGTDQSSAIGDGVDLTGMSADQGVANALISWLGGSNLGQFMGITVGQGTGAGVANPYGSGGSGGQLFDTSVGFTGFNTSPLQSVDPLTGEANKLHDLLAGVKGGTSTEQAATDAAVQSTTNATLANETITASLKAADGTVTAFSGNLFQATGALETAQGNYENLNALLNSLISAGDPNGNIPDLQTKLQQASDAVGAYTQIINNATGIPAQGPVNTGPAGALSAFSGTTLGAPSTATNAFTPSGDLAGLIAQAGAPSSSGATSTVNLGGVTYTIDAAGAAAIIAAEQQGIGTAGLTQIAQAGSAATGPEGATGALSANSDLAALIAQAGAGYNPGQNAATSTVNLGGVTYTIDAAAAAAIIKAEQQGISDTASLAQIANAGLVPTGPASTASAVTSAIGGANSAGFQITGMSPGPANVPPPFGLPSSVLANQSGAPTGGAAPAPITVNVYGGVASMNAATQLAGLFGSAVRNVARV